MKNLDGVLLLTAGYGMRAEPLSLVRPKALLPHRDGTLLGRLAAEAGALGPRRLLVNASRCPDLVLRETREAAGRDAELLFEERPLGVTTTLALLSRTIMGPWMIMNTDMLLRADLAGMTRHHQSSGASCTLLCGDFPSGGSYGSVMTGGRARHYMGVCVLEPVVFERAERHQGFQNLFSPLIVGEPAGFEGAEVWMDMGETELYRRNLLAQGGYVHPESQVSPGAVLSGNCHVSRGCVVESGAVLHESVMLEGSVLESGGTIARTVMPWFSRRSGFAHGQ